MPRQNRVTTYGALIAVPDRGLFRGNRGVLPPAAQVTVITPRATVGVLAAGYRPVIHPSAAAVGNSGPPDVTHLPACEADQGLGSRLPVPDTSRSGSL